MAEEIVVDRPKHYGGTECIEAMETAYGIDAVVIFCTLNAFKYLWRKDHKGAAVADLKKAAWYINWAVERMENTKAPDEKLLDAIEKLKRQPTQCVNTLLTGFPQGNTLRGPLPSQVTYGTSQERQERLEAARGEVLMSGTVAPEQQVSLEEFHRGLATSSASSIRLTKEQLEDPSADLSGLLMEGLASTFAKKEADDFEEALLANVNPEALAKVGAAARAAQVESVDQGILSGVPLPESAIARIMTSPEFRTMLVTTVKETIDERLVEFSKQTARPWA